MYGDGRRVGGWRISGCLLDVGDNTALSANFRICVEHALTHGIAECNADLTAVAVWFPQEREPVPPPADYDTRLANACGRWTARFQMLDAAFEAHHPHRPHHQLALLAVRPDRQSQGLGSALLRRRHELLDRTGTDAYLEASSPRSRALYLRHGYRDLGEPFHLPDNGPPFWPMGHGPAGP